MIVPDRGLEGIPVRRTLWRKLALTTATSAAAIVAVCGAFYLGTVFSNATSEPKAVTSATPATTGSASSPPEHMVSADAEGSAPRSMEQVQAADCQLQTWPYIARPCVASDESKRGVRVIATDKLADPVVSMLEAPPEVMTNRYMPNVPAQGSRPAPSGESAAVRNAVPAREEGTLKSGAALATLAIDDTAKPNAAPVNAQAQADANDRQTAPSIASLDTSGDYDVVVDSKSHRDAARDRAKRKLAKKPEPARSRLARGASEDDQSETSAAESRPGQIKARVVERWNEREYRVPSEEGRGARRVVVTSRDEGPPVSSYSTARNADTFPNIFGAIFGGD